MKKDNSTAKSGVAHILEGVATLNRYLFPPSMLFLSNSYKEKSWVSVYTDMRMTKTFCTYLTNQVTKLNKILPFGFI